MADHYISWNKGDGISPGNITAGTSTTAGDHVELRTLDGAALTKTDVLLAVATTDVTTGTGALGVKVQYVH